MLEVERFQGIPGFVPLSPTSSRDSYTDGEGFQGPTDNPPVIHWTRSGRQAPRPASDDDDDDDNDHVSSPGKQGARERLSYTRYQLELMNNIYTEIRYPNGKQKHIIAKRVGIGANQVKIWFQNRRRKDITGNGKSSEIDTTDGNLVPQVLIKSILAELAKFKEDVSKPSPKGKVKRVQDIKRSHDGKPLLRPGSNNLFVSGYDVASPPNKVTPTAFLGAPRKGFQQSSQIPGGAARNPTQFSSFIDNLPLANGSSARQPGGMPYNVSIGGERANYPGQQMHSYGEIPYRPNYESSGNDSCGTRSDSEGSPTDVATCQELLAATDRSLPITSQMNYLPPNYSDYNRFPQASFVGYETEVGNHDYMKWNTPQPTSQYRDITYTTL